MPLSMAPPSTSKAPGKLETQEKGKRERRKDEGWQRNSQIPSGLKSPATPQSASNVVDIRFRAADEGQGGAANNSRTTRRGALAQRGSEGRQELRAALPRRLLRQNHLPPHYQRLSGSGRRPHRLRHRKLNLLSFGEEAEEEKKELAAVKTEIKSSHDVLDDPRLLKDEVPFNKSNSDAKTRHVQLSIREALSSKKEEPRKDSESKFYNTLDHSDDDDDDEANFDARMRQQILKKRTDLGDLLPKPKLKNGRSSPKQHEIPTSRSNVESIDDDQQKVDKLSLKKKGIGSEARAERMANGDADLQLLGDAERGRQLQKQKKRRNQGREDEVLAKLEKFKKGIFEKHTAPGSESGRGRRSSTDCKPSKSAES
ncbi:LOW QUALITY PROTEIN: peptidyl-prolyl cis-trans isomerase CYP57 [Pyrus x bretschneideri]|uniref:LOW QUALITY PROTEIN: peptidyl-prolyl cis-trans isomerase CYP57 n=1 Tax=Pyrus x bretschneideri TaxID=225117 RepID=UPI00202DFB24|nr:LOW QUALITY PROTEIN: peptidyl-prolyl cis-trans isomerase CYP57 [Pyrus x bretschneideri]